MLIYNHDKEFIGITQEGLRILHCANLNELLNECYDFADLFVKRPGYIHNFKNFNWIDFIMHAEADEAKAIVHIKNTTFSCHIEIKDFSLVSEPSNPAYEIVLTHIKAVSSEENAKIAQEVSSTPRPEARARVATAVPNIEPEPLSDDAFKMDEETQVQEQKREAPFSTPEEEAEPQDPIFPPIEDEVDNSNAEYDPYDVPANSDESYEETTFDPTSLVPDFDKPLEIEDDVFLDTEEDESPLELLNDDGKLDISFDDDEDLIEEVAEEEAPMLGDYISNKDAEYIDNLKTDKDYKYDPQVAADELGLPADLIEEFIEDFIQQAHEFNDELYESAAKEDFDNVKVLSHKLKGVAANLRIEDAFEVLSIVNTSNDREEIEANLKQLNRIIAKLEGKNPDDVMSIGSTATPPTPTEEVEPATDETFNEPTPDIPESEEDIELPPMPDLEDEEEDEALYDLEIKDETLDESPTPALEEEDDDDLYDFAPIESLTEDTQDAPTQADTEEDNDLYALDPLGTDEDDLLPPLPEDNDLYAMDPLDTDDDLLAPLPDEKPEESDEELLSPIEETPVSEAQDDDLYSVSSLDLEEPVEAEQKPLHFDSSKAANELGIDTSIIHELVEDFVSQAKEFKDELENSIKEENFTKVSRQAIILKGISDNLRISEISETLTELSKTQDASTAQDVLTKLYLYIDQL